jgi:hypothetical protein
MASDGMSLPEPAEEVFPASEKVFVPARRAAGGGGSGAGGMQTSSSGDSGSGSTSFFANYWWKALLACIPLLFFLVVCARVPTWPLYLLSESSSVCLGIFVAYCWIRNDRAKARTSTTEGKDGLDQLGFFNSRLAKRNLKLFEIATKEVVSPVPGEPTPPATALVARYWEGKRGDKQSSGSATHGNGDSKKPGDDNDDELMKILQPEYAIGMNIITRDDYNSQMNEYFAQSELSLGTIIPLILIVLGLVLTPQVGLNDGAWVMMCVALAPISGVLFFIGMERWQKYRMELKLLILGNWERLQDAKEQAKPSGNGGGTSKAVQTAVVKAIEGATGTSNLKVDINIKP